MFARNTHYLPMIQFMVYVQSKNGNTKQTQASNSQQQHVEEKKSSMNREKTCAWQLYFFFKLNYYIVV